ncbi:helix-turn-helix domain-containing protein [Micropruina sonneratiae]|uniref:helix-turn-helix domain-containing protein n=1 Tax=Micropruina sonneratiae TaxID=2986940 RepID=UPI00222630D1|nr:XRE family transcriptional regulator [Micropruina sp. KQZ13P-5]MCW3159405.1 XRE family transcriptional regulator [Micropruina sp. KQZ13P-5]
MSPRTSSKEIAALGEAVRTARADRGWSVEQLARESGLSVGIVSQIERGRGNPSLTTMRSLAEGLGFELGDLFGAALSRNAVVVREPDRLLLPPLSPDEPAPGLSRELLTPPRNATLQVIRTVMPAGYSNRSRPFRHLGVESVHVLAGRLRVVTDVGEHLLEAGDTITYDCSTPHWWENPGEVEAVVLGSVIPLGPLPLPRPRLA